MNIGLDPDKVLACLGVARQVAEEYHRYVLCGDHTRKSIDDLRDICGRFSPLPIYFYELYVSGNGQPVKGACIKYPDRCDIFVLLDIGDEDSLRIVTCKEIFQAILDDPQCYSMGLVAHVAECAKTFFIKDGDTVALKATESEVIAEVAAMEFLFPLDQREQAIGAATEDDYKRVAEQYGIPLLYVERHGNPTFVAQLKALFAEQ